MNAGKCSARSVCSGFIELETSITHSTSTAGVVIWTILSVFTGLSSPGGFGSPKAGGAPLMLYSWQPATSTRTNQRMRDSRSEAADRYPRDRLDLVKQVSIVPVEPLPTWIL